MEIQNCSKRLKNYEINIFDCADLPLVVVIVIVYNVRYPFGQ